MALNFSIFIGAMWFCIYASAKKRLSNAQSEAVMPSLKERLNRITSLTPLRPTLSFRKGKSKDYGACCTSRLDKILIQSSKENTNKNTKHKALQSNHDVSITHFL